MTSRKHYLYEKENNLCKKYKTYNLDTKKIYIAGFDVFDTDALKIADYYKEICFNNGFIGLFPGDNEKEEAKEIFEANKNLIKECDIVVANLNNFRGYCMDEGTAYELGYADALGKILYGYMLDTTDMKNYIPNNNFIDENGFIVEDFGYPRNLMIAESTNIVKGNFEDCIKKIRRDLTKKR